MKKVWFLTFLLGLLSLFLACKNSVTPKIIETQVTIDYSYAETMGLTIDNEPSLTAKASGNKISLETFPHISNEDYCLTGLFTDLSSSGIAVCGREGDLLPDVEGYTDSNGKWIYEGAPEITLYAKFGLKYEINLIYFEQREATPVSGQKYVIKGHYEPANSPETLSFSSTNSESAYILSKKYENGNFEIEVMAGLISEESTITVRSSRCSNTCSVKPKLPSSNQCDALTIKSNPSADFNDFSIANLNQYSIKYYSIDMKKGESCVVQFSHYGNDKYLLSTNGVSIPSACRAYVYSPSGEAVYDSYKSYGFNINAKETGKYLLAVRNIQGRYTETNCAVNVYTWNNTFKLSSVYNTAEISQPVYTYDSLYLYLQKVNYDQGIVDLSLAMRIPGKTTVKIGRSSSSAYCTYELDMPVINPAGVESINSTATEISYNIADYKIFNIKEGLSECYKFQGEAGKLYFIELAGYRYSDDNKYQKNKMMVNNGYEPLRRCLLTVFNLNGEVVSKSNRSDSGFCYVNCKESDTYLIYVYTSDLQESYCGLHIYNSNAITEINFEKEEYSVVVGEKVNLTALYNASDSLDKVYFKLRNKSNCKIFGTAEDDPGKLTKIIEGLRPGKETVTAYTNYSDLKKEVTVNVTLPDSSNIVNLDVGTASSSNIKDYYTSSLRKDECKVFKIEALANIPYTVQYCYNRSSSNLPVIDKDDDYEVEIEVTKPDGSVVKVKTINTEAGTYSYTFNEDGVYYIAVYPGYWARSYPIYYGVRVYAPLPVNSISLAASKTEIQTGAQFTVTATYLPSTATDPLDWYFDGFEKVSLVRNESKGTETCTFKGGLPGNHTIYVGNSMNSVSKNISIKTIPAASSELKKNSGLAKSASGFTIMHFSNYGIDVRKVSLVKDKSYVFQFTCESKYVNKTPIGRADFYLYNSAGEEIFTEYVSSETTETLFTATETGTYYVYMVPYSSSDGYGERYGGACYTEFKPITSVAFEDENYAATLGEVKTFNVNINPSNTDDTIFWRYYGSQYAIKKGETLNADKKGKGSITLKFIRPIPVSTTLECAATVRESYWSGWSTKVYCKLPEISTVEKIEITDSESCNDLTKYKIFTINNDSNVIRVSLEKNQSYRFEFECAQNNSDNNSKNHLLKDAGYTDNGNTYIDIYDADGNVISTSKADTFNYVASTTADYYVLIWSKEDKDAVSALHIYKNN